MIKKITKPWSSILLLCLIIWSAPSAFAQFSGEDLSASASDLCNCAESSSNEMGLDAELVQKVIQAMAYRKKAMQSGAFDQTSWLQQWVEETLGSDMNKLASWYAAYTRNCGLLPEDVSHKLDVKWSYLNELNMFFRSNCSLAPLLTFMEITWPSKDAADVALKRCDCLNLTDQVDKKACFGQLYYEYWGYLNDINWMHDMEVKSLLCWPE